MSELGAHLNEEMLGNEAFIDKIIRENGSLGEKILGKIIAFKEALGRIGDPEAQAQHKRLAEAEKLYLDAIEAAGKKYVNGKIVSVDDDEEKEKPRSSYSLKSDAEYLRAVESGDMETAQRMVDEAAEVVCGFTQKGMFRLHDVVNMTPKQFVIKKSSKSLSLDHKRVEYRRNELPDNNIISKDLEKSTPKSKFSLKPILTKRKQTIFSKRQGNNCPSDLQRNCLLPVILYAILKQMSIGKYMAPTSARTLIQGKAPVNISRRRSGSHNNSIHGYGQNVNSF